jgi:hypothetical protein
MPLADLQPKPAASCAYRGRSHVNVETKSASAPARRGRTVASPTTACPECDLKAARLPNTLIWTRLSRLPEHITSHLTALGWSVTRRLTCPMAGPASPVELLVSVAEPVVEGAAVPRGMGWDLRGRLTRRR